MKTRPSGVRQAAATARESPTTAITTSSNPDSAMVRRKYGSESIR